MKYYMLTEEDVEKISSIIRDKTHDLAQQHGGMGLVGLYVKDVIRDQAKQLSLIDDCPCDSGDQAFEEECDNNSKDGRQFVEEENN